MNTLTPEQIRDLEYLRKHARAMLAAVALYASCAEYIVGEKGAAADYIWGNMTLEELMLPAPQRAWKMTTFEIDDSDDKATIATLTQALEEIANGPFGKSAAVKRIARAALA